MHILHCYSRKFGAHAEYVSSVLSEIKAAYRKMVALGYEIVELEKI